jgi:membrane associated rhomboid family serine protease
MERELRARLGAGTRVMWVTHGVCTLNIVVFLAMALAGVSVWAPESLDILAWGGDFGPLLALEDEWWRLVTSSFLHVGVLHLASNLLGLWRFGTVVERLYGARAYLVLCAVSAVLASLASTLAYPYDVGAGASGIVFGVLGAALTAWRRHPRELPATLFLPSGDKGCLMTLVAFLVAPWRLGGPVAVFVLVVMGLTDRGVSIAGHAGGLAAGVAFALLVETRLGERTRAPWWKLGGAVLALVLATLGVRWRLRSDPRVHAELAELRHGTDPPHQHVTVTATLSTVEEMAAVLGRVATESPPGSFVVFAADAARNHFVQFIVADRQGVPHLLGEAVGNDHLEKPHQLDDARVQRLRARGWEAPTVDLPNFRREWQDPREPETWAAAATEALGVLREIYGLPDGAPFEMKIVE